MARGAPAAGRGQGAARGCALVREAISSRLDGEESALGVTAVRAHLDGCAACQAFEASVVDLTRRIRVHALETSPDLTTGILESIGCAEPRSGLTAHLERCWFSWRGSRWLRVSQWAVAVVPLAAAVPTLALGVLARPHVDPSHVATPCTVWLVHLHAHLHLRAQVRSRSL